MLDRSRKVVLAENGTETERSLPGLAHTEVRQMEDGTTHASLASTHAPNRQKAKRGMESHFLLNIWEKTSPYKFIKFSLQGNFSQGLWQTWHTRQVLELHGNGEFGAMLGLELHRPAPASTKGLNHQIRLGKEKQFNQGLRADQSRILLLVQWHFYRAGSVPPRRRRNS